VRLGQGDAWQRQHGQEHEHGNEFSQRNSPGSVKLQLQGKCSLN
jgi:hypothetical protein